MKIHFSKSFLFCFTLLITFIVTSCYKKDLEEFKKVNSIRYEPEIALPFLETKITLADTIPTLPFFLTVSMIDTASITLPASTSKDTLESIIDNIDFKIRLQNTFPFSGKVQIYFADSNNVFVDSLLTNAQRNIPSGTSGQIQNITVSVNKQRYIDLTKGSKKMYAYYNLTTSDISGMSGKFLKINMGIKAKLSVDIIK